MSDRAPMIGYPNIQKMYRLQWEDVQQSYVLLFPEGMVKLNHSAGEILKRCTGKLSVIEIIADLESTFAVSNLADDVEGFLAYATQSGWLHWPEK